MTQQEYERTMFNEMAGCYPEDYSGQTKETEKETYQYTYFYNTQTEQCSEEDYESESSENGD